VRRVLLGLLLLTSFVHAQSFETTVAPLPNETFAGPCHYDLTLPVGRKTVRAVWVTFDRGQDIMKFYSDSDVVQFARRQRLALMMPHQCPAKDAPGGPHEMDMDPAHGVGPALFRALDQFAKQSSHSELSSAKLIVLGFSGTGAMFAHFVGYAPGRIVAAVLTDPGHYDPMGVDKVRLPPAGMGVPEFIIAGGADKVCGTQKPYNYFHRYRDQGAPWTFLVQNQTPHCCIINTKWLVLEWLKEVIELRQPSAAAPLRPIDPNGGGAGFLRTCATDIHDDWGNPTWNACDASVRNQGDKGPAGHIPAGWLPSRRFAKLWLAFVKQPTHSTESLP